MIYSDTFGRNDFWTVTNYFNRLGIEVNGRIKGICINGPTNQCDTAWSATSSIIPLKGNGQRYRLSFCIGATMAIKMPNNDGEDWRSTILWYGVGGKVILKSPITYSAPKSGHTRVVMHGDIPEGAVSFSLKFGFDKSDIGLANRLMFSDLSFEEMPISPSYAAEAEFVSEVHEGGNVVWRADVPDGCAVHFQWRGLSSLGDVSKKSFVGPDGTDRTFFDVPFVADAPMIQYRVILRSNGTATPMLYEVNGGVSRYADYVTATDGFLPEIYPIYNVEGDPTDKTCVAITIRDMKQIAEDVRLHGRRFAVCDGF